MRKHLWLGYLSLLFMTGFICQCASPVTIDLPWSSPACLTPPPKCANQQFPECKSGTWSCSTCFDGETRPCYSADDQGTRNKGICKEGTQTCIGHVWSPCQGEVGPLDNEQCGNGKDDNCNGQTDEGCICAKGDAPRPCGSNEGLCQQGTQTCNDSGQWDACKGAVDPTPERCDGKDNDCDGQVDENFKAPMYKEQPLDTACSVGKGICKRTGTYICNDAQTGTVCSVKAGQKKTEICDGKDNDCNGQIDEPWPNKGKDCDNGQQGGCRKTGKWVCKNDNQGIRCTAPSVTQGPEVCDGKDNDCNGKIDENWSNDLGKSCDNGSKGECFKAGKIVCDSSGNGTICDAPNNVTGTAEVCNGKDDDCDGQTDEDISEVGQQCKVPNQQDSNCEQGKWACESNQLTCKTTAQTQSESCNGDDDDCNGKIDDIAPKECWKNGKRGKKYCRQGDWSDCKR